MEGHAYAGIREASDAFAVVPAHLPCCLGLQTTLVYCCPVALETFTGNDDDDGVLQCGPGYNRSRHTGMETTTVTHASNQPTDGRTQVNVHCVHWWQLRDSVTRLAANACPHWGPSHHSQATACACKLCIAKEGGEFTVITLYCFITL